MARHGSAATASQRGLSLFAECVDDPAATAAAFKADGLPITGDRVLLGIDESYSFADRSRDMLEIGGENVAASEIETVIAAIEGVAEVAVVGMPHTMRDEVAAAFVICKSDAKLGLDDQTAAHCQEQLADVKRPYVSRFVEALPRSRLNKVVKPELRRLLEKEAYPASAEVAFAPF